MVSPIFIVSDWIALASSLGRVPSLLLMIICATMLGLGLSAYRYYICLASGFLAWLGGVELGQLMHVTPWFVGLPLGLCAAVLVWPRMIAKRLLSLTVGFVFACVVGTVLTYVLNILNFWVGFSAGLAAGMALAFLARRFMSTLMFAGIGSVGFLVTLGGVVRARNGFFSPGGYAEFYVLVAIIATILFIISTATQTHLDTTLDL